MHPGTSSSTQHMGLTGSWHGLALMFTDVQPEASLARAPASTSQPLRRESTSVYPGLPL